MQKLLFNPPPGWVVQESGWMPSVSWQPPPDWPPVPPGWPLFYVRRGWFLPMLLFWLCLFCGAAAYGWLMAAVGKPLPQEAYGLIPVFVLASMAVSRLGTWKKAPLTKWPWLPHHPAGPQSAITDLRRR